MLKKKKLSSTAFHAVKRLMWTASNSLPALEKAKEADEGALDSLPTLKNANEDSLRQPFGAEEGR